TAAAVGREAMIEIPLELFRKFEAFEAENAELRTTLIDTCQKLGQLKGESERDKAQLTTQAERLKEAEELLMEVGNIKPSTNAYGGAEHWSIRYGLIKRINAFCPPATPPPGSQEGHTHQCGPFDMSLPGLFRCEDCGEVWEKEQIYESEVPAEAGIDLTQSGADK